MFKMIVSIVKDIYGACMIYCISFMFIMTMVCELIKSFYLCIYPRDRKSHKKAPRPLGPPSTFLFFLSFSLKHVATHFSCYVLYIPKVCSHLSTSYQRTVLSHGGFPQRATTLHPLLAEAPFFFLSDQGFCEEGSWGGGWGGVLGVL